MLLAEWLLTARLQVRALPGEPQIIKASLGHAGRLEQAQISAGQSRFGAVIGRTPPRSKCIPIYSHWAISQVPTIGKKTGEAPLAVAEVMRVGAGGPDRQLSKSLYPKFSAGLGGADPYMCKTLRECRRARHPTTEYDPGWVVPLPELRGSGYWPVAVQLEVLSVRARTGMPDCRLSTPHRLP